MEDNNIIPILTYNNPNLIPFNIKYFNVEDFKSIMQKYSYFNNTWSDRLINSYFLHIFDCNKDYVGYFKFQLPFNMPLTEDDLEYELAIHLFNHYLIKTCNTWSNKFALFLPDPYQFYMRISDKDIGDEI